MTTPKELELFNALRADSCSTCNRAEPKDPLPGWPNSGRFLVIRNGKLCFQCAREAMRKLQCLGGVHEDSAGKPV